MKLLLALAGLAAVAGCADGPRPGPGPANWGYQQGQRAPAIISEAEAATLTEQVVNLKAQRTTLANNLPRTRDPATRSQHVRALDEINEVLQQLEYRLRAAGRPVPR